MAVFTYDAATTTTIFDWKTISRYYSQQVDDLNTLYDVDEYNGTDLIASGLDGDFKFTINGVERTHLTQSGSCSDANILALGTFDGTELFLLTYIDQGKLHYAVYDWNGNVVKDFTALHDATELKEIYYNGQGDIVLAYAYDDQTFYSSIASGYDGPPVANENVVHNSQADMATSVSVGVFGRDPGAGFFALADIAIEAIQTSDGSTGSVLILKKDAYGGMLAIYTGVLAQGETATASIAFSIADDNSTDTDGHLTLTFTGTGSDLVKIDAYQASSLIAAGYDSLADIGGSIAGFSLTLGGTPGLTSEKLDAFIELGVTEVSMPQGLGGISPDGIKMLMSKGLGFAAADEVTLSDRDCDWIKEQDADMIADLAAAGVDMISSQVNKAVLDLDLFQAIIDNGITFGQHEVITLSATADEIFALDANELDILASARGGVFDFAGKDVTRDAASFETLRNAGFSLSFGVTGWS